MILKEACLLVLENHVHQSVSSAEPLPIVGVCDWHHWPKCQPHRRIKFCPYLPSSMYKKSKHRQELAWGKYLWTNTPMGSGQSLIWSRRNNNYTQQNLTDSEYVTNCKLEKENLQTQPCHLLFNKEKEVRPAIWCCRQPREGTSLPHLICKVSWLPVSTPRYR